VQTSGYFKLNSAALDTGRCSLGTSTTAIDFSQLIIADDSGAIASTAFVPFAGTRGFAVTPGSFTVNLVCDIFGGAVDIRDSIVTATFIGQ
jgi:hypothetical protein